MKFIVSLIGWYFNTFAYVFPQLIARQAFRVFCTPFGVKLKPQQLAFLEAAENFSFDYNGTLIAGYKWGTGSNSVLCVHGWQSHSYRWKKFIEMLDKDKYTVYAIDAMAHGKSEGKLINVPMYADLIEYIMVEKKKMDYIFAHSLGAFSCMYCFYKNPSISPKKIVCMASPRNAMDFVDEMTKQVGLSEKVVKLVVDRFVSLFNKPPEFFSANRFASKQVSPALIIHDENDKDVSVQFAYDIHEAWPESELLITKGFGHKLRHVSVPEAAIRFIES